MTSGGEPSRHKPSDKHSSQDAHQVYLKGDKDKSKKKWPITFGAMFWGFLLALPINRLLRYSRIHDDPAHGANGFWDRFPFEDLFTYAMGLLLFVMPMALLIFVPLAGFMYLNYRYWGQKYPVLLTALGFVIFYQFIVEVLTDTF